MKKDPRPHCTCPVYPFPHKADSKKCSGRAFLELYLYNISELCMQCNCYNEDEHSCDALEGRESLKEAECYRERVSQNPSERLPTTMSDLWLL